MNSTIVLPGAAPAPALLVPSGTHDRVPSRTGAPARLLSPKGWNKPAQGNALGTEGVDGPQALKGRNNLLVRRNLLRPFRACKPVSGFASQGVALG
jgi:hypothetical protein